MSKISRSFLSLLGAVPESALHPADSRDDSLLPFSEELAGKGCQEMELMSVSLEDSAAVGH